MSSVNSPVDVLLAVADIGGRLGIAGDGLRLLLPAKCPAELKNAIRHHKQALLVLLRADFLIVRSDLLRAIVFWTPDDKNRDCLINAGAGPGCIYTAAELDILV